MAEDSILNTILGYLPQVVFFTLVLIIIFLLIYISAVLKRRSAYKLPKFEFIDKKIKERIGVGKKFSNPREVLDYLGRILLATFRDYFKLDHETSYSEVAEKLKNSGEERKGNFVLALENKLYSGENISRQDVIKFRKGFYEIGRGIIFQEYIKNKGKREKEIIDKKIQEKKQDKKDKKKSEKEKKSGKDSEKQNKSKEKKPDISLYSFIRIPPGGFDKKKIKKEMKKIETRERKRNNKEKKLLEKESKKQNKKLPEKERKEDKKQEVKPLNKLEAREIKQSVLNSQKTPEKNKKESAKEEKNKKVLEERENKIRDKKREEYLEKARKRQKREPIQGIKRKKKFSFGKLFSDARVMAGVSSVLVANKISSLRKRKKVSSYFPTAKKSLGSKKIKPVKPVKPSKPIKAKPSMGKNLDKFIKKKPKKVKKFESISFNKESKKKKPEKFSSERISPSKLRKFKKNTLKKLEKGKKLLGKGQIKKAEKLYSSLRKKSLKISKKVSNKELQPLFLRLVDFYAKIQEEEIKKLLSKGKKFIKQGKISEARRIYKGISQKYEGIKKVSGDITSSEGKGVYNSVVEFANQLKNKL